MGSRGKKSAAELAGRRMDGRPSPLTPPAYLTIPARSLFVEIVSAVDGRHFNRADLPVLVSFVQATLMARSMADNPQQFGKWEKAARLQASLATRLRLVPSARFDPKTIGRRQFYDGPRPWLNEDAKEDDDG